MLGIILLLLLIIILIIIIVMMIIIIILKFPGRIRKSSRIKGAKQIVLGFDCKGFYSSSASTEKIDLDFFGTGSKG